MNRYGYRALATLGFVLAAALPGSMARGDTPEQAAWSPQAAAQYLDGRADWWLNWSGAARGQGTVCISCHTAVPFALARPALAARLGETAVDPVEQRLLDSVRKRVQNWDKIVAAATGKDPFSPFYPKQRKPSALGTESVLNALVLVNHDTHRVPPALSAPTRQALAHLWEQQQGDGAWLWLDFGLRPWETDGTYFGASLAAVAVGTAGKDYYDQAGVREPIAALRKYLRTQFPQQSLHHRVLGLWASSRLPDILTAVDQQRLLEELQSVQEADGGWSLPKLGKRARGPGAWQAHGVYPPGMVSDGYATGLVVLGLKRAGVAADNPQLKKGIAWLVANQKDGSWPANYPNRPRNPQDNIGKFMRDAATAFAVLALTE